MRLDLLHVQLPSIDQTVHILNRRTAESTLGILVENRPVEPLTELLRIVDVVQEVQDVDEGLGVRLQEHALAEHASELVRRRMPFGEDIQAVEYRRIQMIFASRSNVRHTGECVYAL